VRETPLQRCRWLSERSGANVFLKLENLQETGAFKLRGAANKLLSLSPTQAKAGVVTASTGNHALAIATMGRKLGIATEVFVSEHIDPQRLAAIQAIGAQVNKVAGDALAAEVAARKQAELSGREYVSPYNDERVIEGQGTLAVEILRQLPQSSASIGGLDAIFVAVGGGGLIGGIGAHLKRESAATQVVGCWPESSHALEASLRAGRIVEAEEKPTLSTSTAGGLEPGAITFLIAQQVIDRCVLVSEDEILDSLRRHYAEEECVVEGAAGVALAGLLQRAKEYEGKNVVVLICGGNVAPSIEKQIRA
jgi:threonine dehydratase